MEKKGKQCINPEKPAEFVISGEATEIEGLNTKRLDKQNKQQPMPTLKQFTSSIDRKSRGYKASKIGQTNIDIKTTSASG